VTACTHASVAHKHPGDWCPWACGTRLTVDHIRAANAWHERPQVATVPGGGAPVPRVGAPQGPAIASGVSVDREAAAGPPPRCVTPDATPRARRTDPPTAHDAARHAHAGATLDAWLVLAAHLAAENGLTGDELAAVTGRKYEHVGPRRKPLTDAGWLVRTDKKRGGKGVWEATSDGHYGWATAPADVRRTVQAALDAAKQAAA
jgi:hypothetical protein